MSNNDIGVAIEIMLMAIVISVILLFLGIGVLVLIHVCIVGRAIRAGLGNSSAIETGRNESISMSQDDLEKLPCYDYIAKSKGSSPVDCAVCLDNFKAGDKCRLLPICKHSFHAQCVDAWLLKTPICPICRTSADSRRVSLATGEESSHFSDTSTDHMTASQTTESSNVSDATVDLREGQAAAASGHFMSAMRIDLRESQTTESRDVIN